MVQLCLLAGHLDPRSGLGAVDLGERGLLHLRGRVRIRVGLVRRVRASGGSESGGLVAVEEEMRAVATVVRARVGWWGVCGGDDGGGECGGDGGGGEGAGLIPAASSPASSPCLSHPATKVSRVAG